MNVWAVLTVMWRRWYVALPLLAVAVGVAVAVPKDSKPVYTIESVLALQAPSTVQDYAPGSTTQIITKQINPLLVNSGNLSPTASLLSKVMMSRAQSSLIAATGFDGAYIVTPTDKQPIVTVDTSDTDRAAAIAANKKVIDLMTAELDRRQSALLTDPTEKVTVGFITQGETAKIAKVSKWRAGAAILLAGILVALTLSVLFDAAMGRRGRRRTPRSHAATGTEVGVRS